MYDAAFGETRELELRTVSSGRVSAATTVDLHTPIVPQTILFDFDSSTMSPAALTKTTRIARRLRAYYPHLHPALVGNSDDRGTRAYNHDLSLARATAVAHELERDGVPASHLTVIGRGELDPVAPNSTANRRKLNRRVDLNPSG